MACVNVKISHILFSSNNSLFIYPYIVSFYLHVHVYIYISQSLNYWCCWIEMFNNWMYECNFNIGCAKCKTSPPQYLYWCLFLCHLIKGHVSNCHYLSIANFSVYQSSQQNLTVVVLGGFSFQKCISDSPSYLK